MELLHNKKYGYFPNKYPNSIKKNGKIEVFIPGEGYKTVSGGLVQDIKLPDKWDESLTWFDIAKYGNKYGINVAEYYAVGKTAGIVARQTAKGYIFMYEKIKDLINEQTFDKSFFNLLRWDYMLSCYGYFMFDILGFDKALVKIDPEYNDLECTYKGKTDYSMNKYITEKYGIEYTDIINRLNEVTV
jgi:hypothetical protein